MAMPGFGGQGGRGGDGEGVIPRLLVAHQQVHPSILPPATAARRPTATSASSPVHPPPTMLRSFNALPTCVLAPIHTRHAAVIAPPVPPPPPPTRHRPPSCPPTHHEHHDPAHDQPPHKVQHAIGDAVGACALVGVACGWHPSAVVQHGRGAGAGIGIAEAWVWRRTTYAWLAVVFPWGGGAGRRKGGGRGCAWHWGKALEGASGTG